MAKVCSITGKKPLKGHKVSHSNIKTIRRQEPNLQKKRIENPATGRMETVLISTSGLRTLEKWREDGKAYDLRDYCS